MVGISAGFPDDLFIGLMVGILVGILVVLLIGLPVSTLADPSLSDGILDCHSLFVVVVEYQGAYTGAYVVVIV